MNLERLNTFNNDIIILDGLWGTGKSILGPIISEMDAVEKIKAESIYEYISWLFSMKKIDKDAAIWIMKTYVDSAQYHNRIGREINLRWNDDTGLKHVINKWQYIKRLFGKEGDFKIDEINKKNIAFSVMSHMLMLAPDLLDLSYGSRVKLVEIVRHPLYMVNHFASYLDRFDSSREFTMSYYYREVKIPWFINEWKDEFVNGNKYERAVQCIVKLYPIIDEKVTQAKKNGIQILDLSFEEVVFETNTSLKKLEDFLGRKHTKNITSVLKKQKLPRKTILSGKGHSSYGWKQTDKSELDSYNEIVKNLNQNCSKESLEKILLLTDWYNKKYPSKLSKFSVQ